MVRSSPGNPFAEMNYVFIPYCTGDMHSGTKMETLTYQGVSTPTYFYGATDMDLFLKRIVPTFAGTTRVWVTGTSAGGFGTYLNFGRVAAAFNVGVDILDDSGPPLVAKSSTTNTNAGLFDIWGTGAGLPSGCSTCNSLRDVLNYDLMVQATYSPPGQFGFMSFDEDTTIAPDFGYDPVADYPTLMANFSASLPMNSHVATFLVSNYEGHVVQSVLALESYYMPWLTQMVNRDPSWADATHDGGM